MDQTTKKVLVVTPLFPSEEKPYYCIYLLQLFEAFKQRGHSVDVLIPDSSLPDGEIVKKQYRGFQLFHIGHTNNRFTSFVGKMSPGFSDSAKKTIKEIGPHIIDLNLCSIPTAKFMILLAKKLGILSVVHYHGLNVFRNYQTSHPLVEEISARNKLWIANHANGIVGVSNKVAEIVRNKSKSKAVYTVYNGVDDTIFYPQQTKKNDVFTIICVANLIPIKGHELLIRAAHRVWRTYGHNLKLQIVGKGPEEGKLQQLVEQLGMGDMVDFLGELNYNVVAQKIRETDFFVMPSYFESLGCVYLEAMASGVAALGVKGCGIDEVIEDRVNGYIVSPRSIEEIEKSILFAIENPEKHEEIAKKGYETVIEKYLWKHAGQALDRVYDELCNGRTENARL